MAGTSPTPAAPRPPLVSAGGRAPFLELVRSRILEFCREPEALFLEATVLLDFLALGHIDTASQNAVGHALIIPKELGAGVHPSPRTVFMADTVLGDIFSIFSMDKTFDARE